MNIYKRIPFDKDNKILESFMKRFMRDKIYYCISFNKK